MSDFLEDLVVGAAVETGSYTFTAESIVAFASRFDPQAFHFDAAAAAQGPFGRLAASGWHTAAAWMQCYVAYRTAERARFVAAGEAVSLLGPSPGFSNLRWLRPVCAGDTIRFGYVVTGKRAVARPGWGLATRTGTGHDADGVLVYSFEAAILCQKRPR